MTEKIQMTEEQFRDMQLKIIPDSPTGYSRESIIDTMLYKAKQAGYIKKSELQQKVEDVEDYYKIFKHKDYNMEQEYNFIRESLIFCYETIQLLKKDHPEFKEK